MSEEKEYEVTVTETVTHVVTVRAETAEEAEELAIQEVIDDDRAHFTGVTDRSAEAQLQEGSDDGED